jgi:hypothetical protein
MSCASFFVDKGCREIKKDALTHTTTAHAARVTHHC